MTVAIPKTLGHIWIGPLDPPLEWMRSWRDHHPGWDYRLYDNDVLLSRRWRHQALIYEYYRRGHYAGVSDLMRYQILYEQGGFLPEADSRCLRPTDALWTSPSLYTVYENENRGGLVSPFLAAAPRHPYLRVVNLRIARHWRPETLGPPWRSVGNRFLMKCIAARPPADLVVFPSHYFIPEHKRHGRYTGEGPVYCEQFWGSTKGLYGDTGTAEVAARRRAHLAGLAAFLTREERAATADAA